MKGDLSASRTLQALFALRTYLQRFATAVRDPKAAGEAVGRKDGFLVKVMGDSLLLLAELFHENYGIEDKVTELEKSAKGLSSIPERSLKTTSRPARKLISRWFHAPAPLNTGALIGIGLAVIWLLPTYEIVNASARFVVSAGFIMAVLGIMKDSLRKWAQEWISS